MRDDGSAVSDSIVNDAAIPIVDHYDFVAPLEHPALTQWVATLAARGRPFRPEFKMYTGHGSSEMTAHRLALLQELGAESLLLAWDLPSQLGFDPDHRLSRSQVGRAGVSCATLNDMRSIVSLIDLGRLTSFGTLANSLGHVGLAMVLEVLNEAGADTPIYMQNDPLKEFTARGTEIFSPDEALRLACDAAEYAVRHDVPGHAITVCSNHHDIAGAGPVVALGFALANGVAYLDDLVRRGLDPARASSTLSFFVNERSDFFIGAALFRSTRVLWADILDQRYGLKPDAHQPLHLMGYAHGLEAPEEPLVNVARVAVSVGAATLGGADTLCCAAYDEALRIPSDDAAALALRTIQVASSEHGMSDTVDGLRGSYKYESLCDEIISRVRTEFDSIEERGGAIACIENGYALSRLTDGQNHRHQQLKSGARPWFGVNVDNVPGRRSLFSGQSQGDFRLREVESELYKRARLAKLDESGDVKALLENLERVTASGENVMDATRVVLRAGATSEQIIAANRRGFAVSGPGAKS